MTARAAHLLEALPGRIARRIVIDEASGCWIWTGYRAPSGYGYLKWGPMPNTAHRVVYLLLVGEVPPGWELHHECRNPGCVFPGHLTPLSKRDHALSNPNNIMAAKATQTHCLNGHELTGDNVYPYRGKRYCRACQKRRDSDYRARRRVERLES